MTVALYMLPAVSRNVYSPIQLRRYSVFDGQSHVCIVVTAFQLPGDSTVESRLVVSSQC